MSSTPPLPEEHASDDAPAKRNARAKLLPPTRFGGPIPWVIAILIALVVIAAAGGLALRNLAENARADLSGAVTVQIVEANAETRATQADAAAQALGNHPLVTSVRIVPESELAELLEPWLGANAASGDLPIPALIDALDDEVFTVRNTAARALVSLGDDTTEAIRQLTD